MSKVKDLRAKIALDTSDLSKGERATTNFSKRLATDLKSAGVTGAASVDQVRSKLDGMIKSLERSGQGSSAAAKELQGLRARLDTAAASMAGAGKETNRTADGVSALHDRLEKLGPVGATISKRFEEMGITGKVAAGGLIGLAAAGVLVAIKLGMDAAHAASDLNEQISATSYVFKSATPDVISFAQAADHNLGLSETAALKSAAAFGDLFKNVGVTEEATARYSKALVGLSGDIASFKNLDPQDVLEKLRMGLTGQLDVLRELGVFIDDNVVQQEALRLGLEKTTGAITESDKVIARYNLILQQTSTSQGDMARTADSAANQQRQVAAEAENLKAKVGGGLLPVLQAWLFMMGQVVHGAEILTGAVQVFNDNLATNSTGLAQSLRMLEGWGGQLMSTIGAHQRGATAATDYSAATAKSTDKQKDYKQALKEVETALQGVNDATIAGFNKDLAYQQSVLASHDAVTQYTDAAKAAADAQHAYGARSTQAAQANEDLQKAQIGAQQAAVAQAQAAVEAAKQTHEMAGQSFTARDAADVEAKSLQGVADQLAPGSPLRVNIEAYIQTLNNRIPKEIQTRFDVIINQSGAISTSGGATVTRAAGGPVVPGSVYTVGESGPETLVMGASGGVVIPHAASGGADMRATNRLLSQVVAALAVIAGNTAAGPAAFSNAAYGR